VSPATPNGWRASIARRRRSPPLNHPHIAQIYGFEQTADGSALVMELVDGEDLAQRIPTPWKNTPATCRPAKCGRPSRLEAVKR
jgi:serine/threonine protein kinase